MEVLNQVCSKGMTSFPLLPAPKKLFGFTYVSFFIEKTTFSTGIPATGTNAATTTAAVGRGAFGFTRIGGGFGTKGFGLGGGRRGYMGGDTGNPSSPTTMAVGRAADAMYFVRVSVYNAKGKLTEAQQVRGRTPGEVGRWCCSRACWILDDVLKVKFRRLG